MKNTIKKISIVLLVVLLSFVCLTACDDSETDQGQALYDFAVKNGFEGTEKEWLAYLRGDSGYDVAINNGFTGTEAEWLETLKGKDGMDGTNAPITVDDLYQAATENGFEGTMLEFIREYINVGSSENIVSNDSLFASVSIYCKFTVTTYVNNGWRGIQPTTQETSTAGSGVIYRINKEEGSAYIITNYHVIYYAEANTPLSENIYVCLYGSELLGSEFYGDRADYEGMGIKATYIGGSLNYDIAVLYIENSDILKESNAVAANFSDSNDIHAGDTAIAIGNAEGDGISITKGIVSVDSETITMTAADEETQASFRVLRIDSAVNSGNSGGGLFGEDGKLIGIVNAKAGSESIENIGYALPSNVVRYVTENILYYKDDIDKKADVRKCMLGITIRSDSSRAVLEKGEVAIEETVVVNDVSSGALAEGKLQKDDVLKSFKILRQGSETYEEYKISRSFIVVDLMLTMRVGDTMEIHYERNVDGTMQEQTATFVMNDECISEIA